MAQVFCLGEALIDRLLPWGDDLGRDCLGGAPANGACALARLGTAAGFVGRLGRDPIGAAFAELFDQRCLDTTGLQWDEQRPSRVVLVERDASGDRCFGGFDGDLGAGFADTALAADQLPAGLGTGWLACGTIPLATPTSALALEQAISRHRAGGGRLVLDVNWRPTFWGLAADAEPTAEIQQQMQPLLRQADLLKLAAEEAEGLFSSRDPQAVAAALPQRPAVVVTDGGKGVSWSMGAASGALPAYRVPVVDTTGAGDAFLAGLLHRLVKEPTLLAGSDPDRVKQALQFASACGALVCQGAGAIDPQPAEAAVLAFIEQQPAG